MQERYIVRDSGGHYQASYNFLLGKDKAYQYALQTARRVNGAVYYFDDSDSVGELELYNAKNYQEI